MKTPQKSETLRVLISSRYPTTKAKKPAYTEGSRINWPVNRVSCCHEGRQWFSLKKRHENGKGAARKRCVKVVRRWR